MNKKNVYLLLITMIFLLISFNPVTAGKSMNKNKEISKNQIYEQMLLLQSQMQEMQQKYETRINSLEKEIDHLKNRKESNTKAGSNSFKPAKNSMNDEIDSLRASALDFAEIKGDENESDQEQESFDAGNLSLQASNPEISVTGDVIFSYQNQDGIDKKFDSNFRSMAIHFESYLDPETKFKGAFPITESGTSLGEAYITRYGFTPSMNLTLGKFRQQFGVVNRWHKHGLDQTDFPLAMRRIFGDGGLNQKGVSLDWQLGKLSENGSSNNSRELKLQITEGENPFVFGQNSKGMPSVLLHYKNYHDVNVNTYHEFGLTAMAGTNDNWKVMNNNVLTDVKDTKLTWMWGLDFTRLWEPQDQMRYKNFVWRTEFYNLYKEILAPDGSGDDTINTWGAYTNFQWKLDRKYEAGLRYDYFQPDTISWNPAGTGISNTLFSNLESDHQWQITPYVTLHQSPWVRYRLEYNYLSGNSTTPDDRRIMFQCIWAAGPHKHDRY